MLAMKIYRINGQICLEDMTSMRPPVYLKETSQEALYQYLRTQEEQIDFALIDLDQPIRNTLYALYPRILIMIQPTSVLTLFMLEQENSSNLFGLDEVAAAACSTEEEKLLVDPFIFQLYAQPTKLIALDLYRAWQLTMPLDQPALYRRLRTLEYYKEEIFHYFDRERFPSCFSIDQLFMRFA